MQANGNDYIFFDFLDKEIPKIDFNELAVKFSNRHFGIGSDGIVLILKDGKDNAFMRIFNADGSEAKMCGTALMCVISYLAKKSFNTKFTINTLSGIKTGKIDDNSVRINMGTPKFINNEKLNVKGFAGFLINIGNNHFVTFVDELPKNIAEKNGSIIENEQNFTDGINVQFAKIINRNHIKIKIWERGSGATFACGTGACAVVFTGISKNILNDIVQVQMPGGKVKIEYINNTIFLTGKPEFIFEGNLEI